MQSFIVDHDINRKKISVLNEAIRAFNNEVVIRELEEYKNALEEHIRKEDDNLFPWLDLLLSSEQINDLHKSFLDVDTRLNNIKQKYERYILSLEDRYPPKIEEI